MGGNISQFCLFFYAREQNIFGVCILVFCDFKIENQILK